MKTETNTCQATTTSNGDANAAARPLETKAPRFVMRTSVKAGNVTGGYRPQHRYGEYAAVQR
jgi:hypothetical protein